MNNSELENLLTEINEEFVKTLADESEAVLLDVELSGSSPTCKCMRANAGPAVGGSW